MRDPRLAEIEFLMDLDRVGSLQLRCNLDPKARFNFTIDGVPAKAPEPPEVIEDVAGATIWKDPSPPKRYGLDPARFRDMVVDLMLRDFITGGVRVRPDGDPRDDRAFVAERRSMLSDFLQGKTVYVKLSHAGRVHVWDRSDTLMRDPDLEPFGLRSRAAWDRDLFLRLQFASDLAPLSMMFLDLDNFGAVNKTLGAPIGDAVLRVVFELVKNIVGTRGAAYRYGGEEIGVLLPGIDRADAVALAETLRATIERDVHLQVRQLTAPQTASIGVAAFDGSLANDAAVARADQFMRAAKTAGKNRVVSG